MTPYPRITLEPLGIEVLDLRPALQTIRRQHGPRYHCIAPALWDAASLWGLTRKDDAINRHGAFDLYNEVIELQAGWCQRAVGHGNKSYAVHVRRWKRARRLGSGCFSEPR